MAQPFPKSNLQPAVGPDPTVPSQFLPGPKQHILTIALEDYYQVGSFNQLIQNGRWYRFEPRLEKNTLRTLDLLDKHNIKATFFILGWIADQFPDIVRMVSDRGHEVASKGYYHRSIRQMTPSEFREDLAHSRAALESVTGKRVLGYRVAHEWFKPEDCWALDVLAEEGFAYDSSIGLLLRRFAGEPWRRYAHTHKHGDKELWEFPLSSTHFLGCDIPIAGGNYFRQFPFWMVRRAIDNWHNKVEAPFVMYFHVWELDPEQPMINGTSLLTRIRHYRNLKKMAPMLEYYFQKYPFTSAANYLQLDTRLPEVPAHPTDRLTYRLSREIRLGLISHPTSAPPENGGQEESTPKTKVSVVVPCYNEELILPYLSNTLNSVQNTLGHHYDFRFLFVDDASKDGTWKALQQTFGSWPNATLLRHEKNLGVAAAILTGIYHADSEIVCSIDCDCTYDPHEIGQMVPLLTEDVDMVTASPYHPEGAVRNVTPKRLLLSRVCSWLYRRVLRQKLHTFTSCFRVYRRGAMLDLNVRETGYLGIPEMLAELALQGSKIVEHPSVLEVRMLGRSKMKIVRTIFGQLRLMRRLLFRRWFGKTTPKQTPALITDSTSEVKS